MVHRNDARMRWCWLTVAMVLLTSCAGAKVSRLHPFIRENAGIRRVVQVIAVGTRSDIIAKGGYDVLYIAS